MRHTLIAWVLMVAAGGEGAYVVQFQAVPVAVFPSIRECDIARGQRIKEYRAHLEPPIRSGYDYVEGVAPSHSAKDASTGRQLYILTCEQTKGR